MWTRTCPSHTLPACAGHNISRSSRNRRVVRPCCIYVYLRRYSAFYDNTETWETDLVKIVADFGIQSIYVVGIATDFCVYWTARDAKRLGYNTYVVQVRKAERGWSGVQGQVRMR